SLDPASFSRGKRRGREPTSQRVTKRRWPRNENPPLNNSVPRKWKSPSGGLGLSHSEGCIAVWVDPQRDYCSRNECRASTLKSACLLCETAAQKQIGALLPIC